MKKRIAVLIFAFILGVISFSMAQAEVLTFEDSANLGVIRSTYVDYSIRGGGHLWLRNYAVDNVISFSSPTYVNSFEMNAMPYENITVGIISQMDIAAFDSNGGEVWSTTVDLTTYSDWSTWLVVPVETDNISQITFYSPYYGYGGQFWPSIDNIVINEEPELPAAVQASVEFAPGQLNLASKGNWVTAYIELPEEYYPEDIDLLTVTLNGIQATGPSAIGDYNQNGIPDLMVKFDRAELISILDPNYTLHELTVSGNLTVSQDLTEGTTPFEGANIISVITNGDTSIMGKSKKMKMTKTKKSKKQKMK